MLKIFVLTTAVALAMAAPALADSSSCSQPYAPAAVDGSTATVQVMKQAHDDVVNFIKASDEYQECLNADFVAQEMQAKKDKKPLDPSVQAGVNARLEANQKDKEKVGAEFNAAVMAYKARHP